MVGGISYWEWGLVPSVIIGLMLLAAHFLAVIMHGAIQKKHDLVTYREIVAFSKGEPVDRDNPKNRQARQHRVLKVAVTALSAAIVGFVVGYLMYRTGMVG